MEEILRKTKFKINNVNAVVGMPGDFPEFPRWPDGETSIVEHLNGTFNWIMVFVKSAAELREMAPQVMKALDYKGVAWICFPKKTSKIKTDINRDNGWEAISGMGIKFLNLISVNDTWSAFSVTHGDEQQSEKGRQKSEARTELLAQFMDHTTREMRYPPELEALLEANPAEKAFFQGLSFTNRKEYVEWIVSAKRQETKEQRLGKMIGYLKAGRKNPAGRG
jgi:hypothetical protein